MRHLTGHGVNPLALFTAGRGEDAGSFMDSFFDIPASFKENTYPSVDVIEEKEAFIVEAELPGMKQEDIDIKLLNNELTIKGEKKCEYENKGEDIHMIERSYGAFQRTFILPSDVKADAISAKYTDGVLEVRLPKTEKAKPKEIKIETE